MAKSRKPKVGSHLERHGQKIRVVVRVPPSMVAVLGKGKLKETLPTNVLREAETLKWPVIARLKQIAAGAAVPKVALLVAQALLWREAIRSDESEDGDARLALDEAAARIEREHGEAERATFTAIATGVATPLDTYVDSWLREAQPAGRTEAAYRHAIKKLGLWCKAERVSETIEQIDASVAGRFVAAVFIAKRVPRGTANKTITALSSYWKWLKRPGRAEVAILANPWQGLSIGKKQEGRRTRLVARGKTDKRPFTDREASVLWNGITKQPLADFSRVAAMTGMRRDEVANLQCRDIVDGVITVAGTKSDAALREVPVHPVIAPILAARMAGKEPTDFLFHELPVQSNAARGRGAPISQAFTRARRDLGVDDQPEGERQSRIDLHSWRRWFIRQAVNALEEGATGFTPWTVADVVGHSTEDGELPMTMGRYPGPAAMKARRACVEAVKVPVAEVAAQKAAA